MKRLAVFIIAFFLFLPTAIPQQPVQIKFETISQPSQPFSNQWTFVIDTSSSLQGIFYRTNTAFLEATRHPTDELFFKVITFNNSGNTEVMIVDNCEWFEASERSFKGAAKWIKAHGGVRSFGIEAIRLAYQQLIPNLTILLITDGGFSEPFDEIRQAIINGKSWRSERGLPEPVMAVIGIENKYYTAGNKPSDEVCQAFLKEIGESCGGGYYLVSDSH